MRRRATATGIVLCVLLLAATGAVGPAGRPGRSDRPAGTAGDEAARPTVTGTPGRLPIAFEANHGQTDRRVRFLTRGQGYSLFLTPDEAVLSLAPPAGPGPDPRERAVVRLRLPGATPGPEMTGVDRLPGTANYLYGSDPAAWRTGVPTYAKVRYAGVYPGVDLVYHGAAGELEYDFVVAPGADASVISMAFDGATGVALDRGDVVVSTPAGPVRQRRPVVYQEAGGRRQQVAGRYVLDPGGRVRVRLGRYDRSRPLVIDPVLAYSTRLGGNGTDVATSVAVDAAGHAYLTGSTGSTDFPLEGASQKLMGGGETEAFVARMDPSARGARSLVWSTYLGGGGDDRGTGIAVGEAGDVFVGGTTHRPPGNQGNDFPTTEGSLQPAAPDVSESTPVQQRRDAFLVRLVTAPSGVTLAYSSFLGGAGDDEATAIAVAGGDAYVSGRTTPSSDPSPALQPFPITSGGFQTSPSGSADGFLARVRPSGAGAADLVFSTYLGGSAHDSPNGVALDPEAPGHAYLAGETFSGDFPCRPASCPDTAPGRVFTARLDTGASGDGVLVFATRFGGSASERANAVAARRGVAHVTGQTFSNDFFTTEGAFQRKRSGEADAFIATLDTRPGAPKVFVYSTLLGGWSQRPSVVGEGDAGTGVALASDGDVVVAGHTAADDFPTTPGAFQPGKKAPSPAVAGDPNLDPHDGFLVRFDTSATGPSARLWATYLGGGNGRDRATAVALDTADNAYVAGETASSDFPLLDAPFQDEQGVGLDAFLAKVTPSSTVTPTVAAVVPGSGATEGGTAVVITGTGFSTATSRVNFGDTQVTATPCPAGPAARACFSVESPTRIAVRTPPHARGPVAVTVTTGDATSFRTDSGVFVFGPEGTWRATPPPSTTRYGHTATLLSDGRVLVVGGVDGEGSMVASAELYDPLAGAAGGWTTVTGTGPPRNLPTPRYLHSATLLPDGRVLVAGGADSNGRILQSAELYVPGSGWQPAEPLAVGRRNHTATLLRESGKVLVAGGETASQQVEIPAELYDPNNRDPDRSSWSSTGELQREFSLHTATPLAGDRVMVVGGSLGASLYDLASGSWSDRTVGALRRRHTATALPGDAILVVGGRRLDGRGEVLSLSELLPADAGTAPRPLHTPRVSHAAAPLFGGQVLVAGGAGAGGLGDRLQTSELFHPDTGHWRSAGTLISPRGPRRPRPAGGTETEIRGPAAVLLSSDTAAFAADTAVCGSQCGRVLVTGGAAQPTAELYTPAPTVTSMVPASVRNGDSVWVEITGTGFTHGHPAVTFGGVPALDVKVQSYSRLLALSPPAAGSSSVRVDVATDGGTASAAALFRYTGPPGRIGDLNAVAVSASEIRLEFSATGSVANLSPPAELYVIKQARAPIVDDAGFDRARSLCAGGECIYTPPDVGHPLTHTVTGLAPGTTYHYAVRAVNDDGIAGPLSNSASATTSPGPAVDPPEEDRTVDTLEDRTRQRCAALPPAEAGRLALAAGYSLISLPDGTAAPGVGRLYGWLNQGAGGAYSVLDVGKPMTGGHAYWSWSPCPHLVELNGPGQSGVRLALKAYHASLVGNPSSTTPARASAFDHAARWDPARNGGAGGYHVSGFREPQSLAVGEGIWVFSFTDSTVVIDAGG